MRVCNGKTLIEFEGFQFDIKNERRKNRTVVELGIFSTSVNPHNKNITNGDLDEGFTDSLNFMASDLDIGRKAYELVTYSGVVSFCKIKMWNFTGLHKNV